MRQRPPHRVLLASLIALSCLVQGAVQAMSVKPDPANHPRLFLSRDDIPKLRERVKAGTPKWMAGRVITRCDHLVKTLKLDARRWAKVTGQKPSWDTARDILDLSLGYVLTGKEAHRDLAIAALTKVCEWPTWYIGYEPNRALMLQAAAVAYDMLHDELGPERAQKVAAKLVFECQEMSKFLTGNGKGSIRRNSSMAPRTYAPFGVAAIALKGECPKADEWLKLARESVPQWIDCALDDDGAFFYSSEECYNTLALNYVLGFYIAYQRLTGENLCDVPKLRRNVLFQLYRLEPQRDGQGQFCVYTRRGAGCPQNMVGLAAMLDDGLARWYFEYVHGPHGLSGQGNIFSAEDRSMPLLWWKDVPIEHPDASPRLGRAKLFRGSGKLVLRTGFESTEDIHFSLECGSRKQGHSQADVGNFILNACGERFIDDPGTLGSYAWGMSVGAHNLVLIDNVGPAVSGSGTIEAFVHTDFADYLVADQKPAYDAQSPVQRARRHVLFVRPSCFVVVDDVKKDDKPCRYDLLLHTTRERRAELGDRTVQAADGRFTMRGTNADMLIRFASPANARLAHPTAELVAEYLKHVDPGRAAQGDNKKFLASLRDPKNLPPLFIFAAPTKKKQGLFFTLLHPVRHGTTAPRTTAFRGGDLVAMRVNDQDIIGFNRGEKAVTRGGCTTDAKLFYARVAKGTLVQYLAADATSFQHLGVGFTATERITVALKAGQGRVVAPKPTALTLRLRGIQGIQVDGKPAEIRQAGEQATIDVGPGEHELRIVTR